MPGIWISNAINLTKDLLTKRVLIAHNLVYKYDKVKSAFIKRRHFEEIKLFIFNSFTLFDEFKRRTSLLRRTFK